MDRVIILLAHGSRDDRWREPFEQLVAQLRAEQAFVTLAYLEKSEPTLMQVLSGMDVSSLKDVVIFPLFMSGGGHVRFDIPGLVEEAQKTYPLVNFTLMEPLGEHPAFVSFLKSLILSL